MPNTERLIWVHRATGAIRLDDYVPETVIKLAGGPLSPEAIVAAVIARTRQASRVHDDYDYVGTVEVSALPWEAANKQDVARRYFNTRNGARWDAVRKRVTVNLAAAKEELPKLIKVACSARIDASNDIAMAAALGELSNATAAAVKAYRQSLRELPAKVASEIASLDLAGLQDYAPAWPEKPA